MSTGELAKHFRKNGFAEILLQAEPHPALKLGSVDRRGSFIVEIEQTACIGKHGFAGFG